MPSYIILRDVPKEEARLDLNIYEIKGGFRGFALVPAGVHFVSVKAGNEYKTFWCYLKENEAIVKILDYESGKFQDDEENGEHYKQLALNGSMNQVLIQYAMESYPIWANLTKHLTADNFPLELNREEPEPEPDPTAEDFAEQLMNKKTRYEQAFLDTHNSDEKAFLAEFEFAFLRWFVNSDDEEALARWRHLLQSLYGVGERRIGDNLQLFIDLVEVIITQMGCLPDDYFTPDSFIANRATYLAEDMIDSDIDGVVEKGKEFSAYLEKRGIQ